MARTAKVCSARVPWIQGREARATADNSRTVAEATNAGPGAGFCGY